MITSEVGKKSLAANALNYDKQKQMGVKTTLGINDPKNIVSNPPPRNDRQALGTYSDTPAKMQDAPIDVGILGKTTRLDIPTTSDTKETTQSKLGSTTEGAMTETPADPVPEQTTQEKTDGIF